MSVSINAIPCAPNANSYVTATEAAAFFANQFGYGAWTASLSDDQRAQLLIMATADIDAQRFVGRKFFPRYSNLGQEQALQFPRLTLQDREKEQSYLSTVLDSSSTSTSIVVSELINHDYYPNDFWNGGAVLITSGDYRFEIKQITDFDRSTGTLTTDAFSGDPGAVNAYIIGPIPKEIKECVYWQAWYNYQESGRINARRELQAQGVAEISHHGGLRETYFGRSNRSAARSPSILSPKVQDILNALGWVDSSITLIPVD